jgi:flagellar basal body rod protein FlgG
MHLRIAALALVITTPVAAETQFPVTIPQECFELAQREGVPTVIENKMQATKAKLKLAQMKNSDHLVRECRAAVHRAQEAAAQAGTQAKSQTGGQGGFEAGVQASEARSQNRP